MNSRDAIVNLAQCNAKSLHPIQDIEDALEIGLPFFEVAKDDTTYSGYKVIPHADEGHDNQPRMPFICEYLANTVFPNVSREANLQGYYPIELHDSNSYLDNDKNYAGVLVFAKNFELDPHTPLLPDPFQIGNYGGRLNISDPYQWEEKANKISFFGVTTGDRDPTKNMRIKICNWSRENRDISEFYLTRIAQMSPDIVMNRIPYAREMFANYVDQEHQYVNKILLSVDGNTASWDRLMWIMKSKSLPFKYESQEILWYYPLLQDRTHFVEVSLNSMRQHGEYYMANPNEAKHIIANANGFVDRYINPVSTMFYTAQLFEFGSDNAA